jgi:hypothetical protein
MGAESAGGTDGIVPGIINGSPLYYPFEGRKHRHRYQGKSDDE